MRNDARALPIAQSPHHLPLPPHNKPSNHSTVQMRDTIESLFYEREEGERGDKDKKERESKRRPHVFIRRNAAQESES